MNFEELVRNYMKLYQAANAARSWHHLAFAAYDNDGGYTLPRPARRLRDAVEEGFPVYKQCMEERRRNKEWGWDSAITEP